MVEAAGEQEPQRVDVAKLMSDERIREANLLKTRPVPFNVYFNRILEDPRLARLSHKLICDMIMDAGATFSPDEEKPSTYNFFEGQLFGLEGVKQKVVDFFTSASKRLETRKRILLLMGPVSGGKSTLASMLKRGLERYTKTPKGEVWAISGCPMHEDPLHLIPEDVRPLIKSEHGIHIEGDLCPHCRMMVRDQYDGRNEDVLVERIVFSEKNRLGIGTFAPSDPKSQDISELTGSIDLATVGEYGVESDPRAYRFDGELNIANRGLMEFIEMLKVDPKFMYHLLTLSQEQNIKTGRYAMIYADEIIVAHSNEAEYDDFKSNRKNEALYDRMYVIRVPYNVKVDEEQRIYRKLLETEGDLGDVHVAPSALGIAARYAVLSRLAPPQKEGWDLVKKMRAYNDETVEGVEPRDLIDLKTEDAALNEGMNGVSPRFVINYLSNRAAREGIKCLTPTEAMKALNDGITDTYANDTKKRDTHIEYLAQARGELDALAKREVQKAFISSFKESAQILLDNYVINARLYVDKVKARDPITKAEIPPDETLMRGLEDVAGIGESKRKVFREEIMIRYASLANRGIKFTLGSHTELMQAIEKKLFADVKPVLLATLGSKLRDSEQNKKIAEVESVLIKEDGYCQHCAKDILDYVSKIIRS